MQYENTADSAGPHHLTQTRKNQSESNGVENLLPSAILEQTVSK